MSPATSLISNREAPVTGVTHPRFPALGTPRTRAVPFCRFATFPPHCGGIVPDPTAALTWRLSSRSVETAPLLYGCFLDCLRGDFSPPQTPLTHLDRGSEDGTPPPAPTATPYQCETAFQRPVGSDPRSADRRSACASTVREGSRNGVKSPSAARIESCSACRPWR